MVEKNDQKLAFFDGFMNN